MKRALALVVLTACSTSYTPRQSARLSVIMKGGGPAYVRDGRDYPGGFLGSGLIDAVQGNPLAVAAAETYHNRQVSGFLIGIAGAVCLGVTLGAIVAKDVSFDEEPSAGLEAAAIGCGVVYVFGLSWMISGQPYQYDAINIYNDGVAP